MGTKQCDLRCKQILLNEDCGLKVLFVVGVVLKIGKKIWIGPYIFWVGALAACFVLQSI